MAFVPWKGLLLHNMCLKQHVDSHIDLHRYLLPMLSLQLWYLCHFAALSTLFPFVNLFFRRLGLAERQIGLLTALRPWVSFPAGKALP